MKAPLILTPSTHSSNIFVHSRIVQLLEPQQFDVIRCIFKQCSNKDGIIINNEPGFNDALSVGAFLSAVKTFPVLIICRDVQIWYYELSRINDFSIKIFNEENNNADVLLTPENALKDLPNEQWPIMIVDDIHYFIKKKFFKRICGKIKIGITSCNFLHEDEELRNIIIKWACPKHILYQNIWPYPNYWLRMTWKLINKQAPNSVEYKNIVSNWCKNKIKDGNKYKLEIQTKKNKQKFIEKLKSKVNKKAAKSTKKILTIKEEKKKNNPCDIVKIEDLVNETISEIKNETEVNQQENFILNSLFHNNTAEDNCTNIDVNKTLNIKNSIRENHVHDEFPDSTSKTCKRILLKEDKPNKKENEVYSVLDYLFNVN